MTANNRPVWIVIAVLVGIMLFLRIPASWQATDVDPQIAAATVDGVKADGLSAPEGPWAGSASRIDPDWLLEREKQREADERFEKRAKLLIGGGLSLIIASFAAFIILRTGSAADDRNWAFGTIGAVLGFWIGR